VRVHGETPEACGLSQNPHTSPLPHEQPIETLHLERLLLRLNHKRILRHRERSVAIQSLTQRPEFVALDCHVASLLAMTLKRALQSNNETV